MANILNDIVSAKNIFPSRNIPGSTLIKCAATRAAKHHSATHLLHIILNNRLKINSNFFYLRVEVS
jgi:hypothetical protein